MLRIMSTSLFGRQEPLRQEVALFVLGVRGHPAETRMFVRRAGAVVFHELDPGRIAISIAQRLDERSLAINGDPFVMAGVDGLERNLSPLIESIDRIQLIDGGDGVPAEHFAVLLMSP